jgi:hypothetical protein
MSNKLSGAATQMQKYTCPPMMHGDAWDVNNCQPQFNDQLSVLQFQELCDLIEIQTLQSPMSWKVLDMQKNPAYAVVWSIVLFWGKIL